MLEWVRGTAAGMSYGLARLGLCSHSINDTNRDLTSLSGPAIIGVTLTGINVSHAVAFLGWKDGKAIVVDPLSGRRELTRDELREWWHGGALLVSQAPH